jgi:hypothetical protein
MRPTARHDESAQHLAASRLHSSSSSSSSSKESMQIDDSLLQQPEQVVRCSHAR